MGAFAFQNCGPINLNPGDESASLSCTPVNYRIDTNNTSARRVQFTVLDFESLRTVNSQNFSWTFSENGLELFSAVAPDLRVSKDDLQACHNYTVTASFPDCGETRTVTVDYTADGPDCIPPVEDPPPTPTTFPPVQPAPPGQQTSGPGCMHSTGASNQYYNGGFDYAKAKYCFADINSQSSSQALSQYMTCLQSGYDISGSNRNYYPIIRPGEYVAIEVTLPHPFAYGPPKTLCGFYAQGETGSQCGGVPAAVETWTLSPNPGDFNITTPGCKAQTTVGMITGGINAGACPMDPGRKYFLNIRMGNNCTNPSGCTFLLRVGGIYSGTRRFYNGQYYTVTNTCTLVPE